MKPERTHPKKCPNCKSGRLSIRGPKMICLRCNYENDLSNTHPAEVRTYRFKNK